MSTTWKIGADDRDEQGKIKVAADPDEPRRLADLLPDATAASVTTKRVRLDDWRTWAGVLAGLLLAAALIFVMSRGEAAGQSGEGFRTTSPAPTAPPAPTAAPTAAPALPAAPALAWAVDAFDGQRHYVGPLAAGRPYTLRGADDDVWLQIDAPEHEGAPASGVVWVRAVDLLRRPAAYGPTAAPVAAVPPAPAGQAAYEVPVLAEAPDPTEAPPPPTAAPPTPAPTWGTAHGGGGSW